METLETLHNTSSSSSLTMNQSAAGVSGLGGSHCWEEDGSIHSVCIFVLSVSGVCTIATMLTVYRVIQMILAAVRYGSYNISLLGKPSLKKNIFLLTFVNKGFTPPPNY